MCYVDDIISKTYSLCGLLEDLLLQAPLVTGSLHSGRLSRLVAASVVTAENRANWLAQDHTRLISSLADTHLGFQNSLYIDFLSSTKGVQVKSKIMSFHRLLLFII